MKVQFYSSFDKRSNSTAVPTTTYIETECVLKAPCSVLHPVLQIDINTTEWAGVSNPHSYNYVKIPDFDRWYYVTTWNAANHHIWICELDVDPLASWKDEIGSQSLYVLRSSNIYDNGIIDTTYPAMAVYTRGSKTATSPLHIDKITDGNYVVGIINSASSGTGAVSYYVFTHSQLKTLLNKLMGDTTWSGIDDITSEISTELSKMLFNPFQYVVSCMWFPFDVPTGTAVQDLPYGWWELENVPCCTLAAGANKVFTVSVNVPKHPKASTRGRTVESSVFSKYTLTFEPYGCVSIDSALLYGQGTLYMIGVVDLITGDSTLFLNTTQYNTANNNIMTLNSKIGVPVQLAQIGLNASTGTTTMLAGAVTGAAQAIADSSGGPGALIKNAVSGIADGVAASMMGVQSAGSNGSFALYFASNVELAAIFYDIADRDLDHHGAPLCTTTTLSRIPGYLMISDADVYIPCYPEELEAIQRALTNGFYLEDVSTPPVPEAKIEPLSITENGIYTATGSVDGYSPVVVNVPQGITPTGNINITDTNVTDVTNYATAQVVDANLVAENIKKAVNILGVVGTYEGSGGGSDWDLPNGAEIVSFSLTSLMTSNFTIDNPFGAVKNNLFIIKKSLPVPGITQKGFLFGYAVNGQYSNNDNAYNRVGAVTLPVESIGSSTSGSVINDSYNGKNIAVASQTTSTITFRADNSYRQFTPGNYLIIGWD